MKYAGEYTNEISFPLGGIGSGSIGLGGNGRFLDWEIFNRPSKGSRNGYSHFAIKAIKDGKPTTLVLNGDLNTNLTGVYEQRGFGGFGYGPDSCTMCGFRHFKKLEFCGEFPFATLNFSDEAFPAAVKMTAFNPLIPSDEDNSSIPAAFFEIEIENNDANELEYQVALSVKNPFKVSRNYSEECDGKSILRLVHDGVSRDSLEYGDLTVATDCENACVQTYWYRGTWRDGIVSFWNDFDTPHALKDRSYDTAGSDDTGTVAATLKIGGGCKEKVHFVIAWNVPNAYNYWREYKDENGNHIGWKNYYATLFDTSRESASYALDNWDMLYQRTLNFKNALYGTTLPETVVEAAAANLSVLKSPTVMRLEDGSFYGFEGVHEKEGSCEGTCDHVWNYAYALCFLFPRLERSIRVNDFKYSMAEDGRMGFRTQLPLGRGVDDFHPCVDGHMGSVIKAYREWKLSGDNEWLRENWHYIKKALEYAWCETNDYCWDRDKDGVLEGRQHHTLDMELFGSSAWLQGMYIAALKAAAEMASFLGENDKVEEYSELAEKAKRWTKENLFNGKWFVQKIDLGDKSLVERFNCADTYWNDEVGEIKYQIQNGSSIDQLLGQWHADIVGLGEIFDKQQINVALDNMMKNNFKSSMREFTNPWRIFSLNDESGSVICVYPDGVEKPKIPIAYCEETMTGFEYSFAGILCSRGRVADGVKVAAAVRDRFNGKKRNPWNEFECGSNYARSMASYAIIPILSGFEFDLPHYHIGFKPYVNGDFATVWSVDGAWGSYACGDGGATLGITEGKIKLSSFGAKNFADVEKLIIDGNEVPFTFKDGNLRFEPVEIEKSLVIKV